MTGELGQLALCFALALSLVMAGAGLLGARAQGAAERTRNTVMRMHIYLRTIP